MNPKINGKKACRIEKKQEKVVCSVLWPCCGHLTHETREKVNTTEYAGVFTRSKSFLNTLIYY